MIHFSIFFICLTKLLICSSFSLDVSNITVSWNNHDDEDVSDFLLISSLGKGVLPTNAWMGIGFGSRMVKIKIS